MKFYVDKILIVYLEEDVVYTDEQINDELLDHIKKEISDGNIRRIEVENTEDARSLVIFIDKTMFHIGIVDMMREVNYYLDNLSEDTTLIEIDGNYYESRFVHSDMFRLWEVFMLFTRKGEKADFSWFTD